MASQGLMTILAVFMPRQETTTKQWRGTDNMSSSIHPFPIHLPIHSLGVFCQFPYFGCFSWTEKLPLSKTALEKAWLYHEIGRCHLETGNYDDAHDFGEKALAAAHEARDQVWELNSSVLIAQAEGEW